MNRALRRRIIPLWWLALAAALSLLLTIHDTFVIAVFEGYISWCIPYWDSCTSIFGLQKSWPRIAGQLIPSPSAQPAPTSELPV